MSVGVKSEWRIDRVGRLKVQRKVQESGMGISSCIVGIFRVLGPLSRNWPCERFSIVYCGVVHVETFSLRRLGPVVELLVFSVLVPGLVLDVDPEI